MAFQDSNRRSRGDVVLIPQGCKVFNSINISIPDTTPTALTFDTDVFNFGALHSLSVNTGRITFNQNALWICGGTVFFAANAAGLRTLTIRLNGASTIAGCNITNVGAGASAILSTIAALQAGPGDFIELVVSQTSGAPLNVTSASPASPVFWAFQGFELQEFLET